MPQISGIYIIVNTKNGKVYVGQTQNFRERQATHKYELRTGRHGNRHLQHAWNKYGEKSFRFQKLEYCAIEHLTEREQHYIDIYKARGLCYNIALDVKSPMRGRSHTAESRRKLSDSRKGKVHSAETRHKISEVNKNPSAEKRRKMSETHKGRIAHNKGKVHSEETRRKISEAKRNISPETRRKMSEAAKRRHAARKAAKETTQND